MSSLSFRFSVSVLLVGQCLAAQSALPAPGAIADSLVSLRDRTQSYALYLPPGYDTTRKWPVLVMMDPRGRAVRALRLVHAAAERYGYIILSSYNTRSDELFDPNAAAVNAMLADADRLLAVDQHRIYLAGFSGTARAAWEYGYALTGQVAGIMGFGAGFAPGWHPPPRPGGATGSPFDFFGGAGATDFNHEEMQQLSFRLDSLEIRHRIVFYGGPHSWGPVEVMNDGVTWFELQAMRRGLKPADPVWVDSLFRSAMAGAASAAQPLERFRRYRAIAEDFAGVHEIGSAEAEARALGATPQVRHALDGEADRLSLYHDRIERLRAVLADLRATAAPPKVDRLLKRLSVVRLQQEAADSSDRERSLAAARMLEEIYAVSSFYEPRDAMNAGVPARALVLLQLAEAIHPGRADVCVGRQKALRSLGRLSVTNAEICPTVSLILGQGPGSGSETVSLP